MATWKLVSFLEKTQTRMLAATLSLLFLAQQILLPDALNCWWSKDIVSAKRKEWH